jgi:outer membrane murein-binding lipoprotein Lpp
MQRILLYATVLGVFLLAGFAQDAKQAPVATDTQKLAIRNAQHKVDDIEKQQANLGNYILNIEARVRDQADQLGRQHTDAQAALEKAVADATSGVDAKKWTFDRESLNYNPVPQPEPTKAAQPSKSDTPIQQAKK